MRLAPQVRLSVQHLVMLAGLLVLCLALQGALLAPLVEQRVCRGQPPADLARQVALPMADLVLLVEAPPVVGLVPQVAQRAVPERPVVVPELSVVRLAVGLARLVV